MAQTSAQNQRSIPLALFVVALAVLGGRVVVHFAKGEERSKNDLVKWVTPEEASRLSLTSDKPLLYDFTADWCAPCHMLDAEVFRDPQIAAEINARFIPVRVLDRQREEGRNTPAVSALQERYGVQGFPTVVIASRDGTERARMNGFGGRGEFERMMERVR